MTDELAQLLKALHLSRLARTIDEELATAEEQHLSYGELLARLLRAEWHARQESALAWRIKRACLPEQWSLESFPFKRQPGVSQRQMRTFAELEFIGRAENIVFVGPTGVGKTGLASGLLLKALQNGYRGLFVRAQDLFDEMYASLADRSSRRLLNRLASVDLLVVDGPLRDEVSAGLRALHPLRLEQRTLLAADLHPPADWLGSPDPFHSARTAALLAALAA